MARMLTKKRLGRLDDGDAFVPDVCRTHAPLADGDAEAAGEEVIACVTSGEYIDEDARDEVLIEEVGGPFVEYVVLMDGEGAE